MKMKLHGIYCWYVLGLVLTLSAIACIERPQSKNPPGYDLNQPQKFLMPDGLLEISGIALYHNRNDSVYAVQDEDGRIYHLKFGEKKATYSRFGSHGDYEDIAIAGEQVYILRSDGTIFTFKFKNARVANVPNVKKLNRILPAGEYEGIYADEKNKQLYVLCKTCNNAGKNALGHILKILSGNTLKAVSDFSINAKHIEKLLGKKKLSFRPSALAKNVKTNEWYILSSVNKALVITTDNWQIKAAYPLNAALFNQPEGIAFDGQNNLYISNEGDELTAGTILKFTYKK